MFFCENNKVSLTGMELVRTGERARNVFLNPSRKFNLLLVGLGVRGVSPSNPPVCARWTGWFFRECPFLRSLLADPVTVRVGGIDTAALVTDGSGVVPRLLRPANHK